MTTLRQILQQRAGGGSLKGIARMCRVSLRTVKKYVRAAERLDQPLSELLELADHELIQALLPAPGEGTSPRLKRLWARFPAIEKELRRVGVTKTLLWHEYKAEDPKGYNYSQFCYYFQQWAGQQDVVMHLEHKAADKLFVDYAGKKLKVKDWISGEELELEVFVAILPASGYTYVEASENQTLEEFIASVENALHFYGGVPRAIVTDNLKAAVTKSSKYEPKLNETFEDFANHYGTAVLPTRAYKPRDKALVEQAVKLAYQRIYAPLRDCNFSSIEALNDQIKIHLKKHNTTLYQGRDYNRLDRFAEIEANQLGELPAERYEIKRHKWIKVQKNSHVRFGEDAHYYSVPYRFIGKKVKLTYTRRTVEFYYNRERIAFHKRNTKRFAYTSRPDHLPSNHRYVAGWTPGYFLNQAHKIGEPVTELFKAIFERKLHPEQAYKSCMGILHLGKRLGAGRLVQACQRALDYHCISYKCIKDILEKGLDQLDESPAEAGKPPEHDNIRGPEYYQ